jgi:thiamine-phosphate pyrophosphorylase
VQIRERGLETRELLTLADAIAKAARGAARGNRSVRILVNRRLDVALAIGADGVHLGFDGMDAATARSLLRGEAEVGVSAHKPGEIAIARGATYAHLAPIRPPRSKSGGRPPLGVHVLAAATRIGIPIIAQGGVDESNAGEMIRAGAAGVAVTGAILMTGNPYAAAARLRSALDSAPRA